MALDPERPVRVFRNWKRDCWSIMQDGVLHASARQVSLAGVEFVVRASGRQRMLREQRKNVHAYAVGMLVDQVHPDEARDLPALDGREVFYDAWRFDAFVDSADHAPVHAAAAARLGETGVTYRPLTLPRVA